MSIWECGQFVLRKCTAVYLHMVRCLKLNRAMGRTSRFNGHMPAPHEAGFFTLHNLECTAWMAMFTVFAYGEPVHRAAVLAEYYLTHWLCVTPHEIVRHITLFTVTSWAGTGCGQMENTLRWMEYFRSGSCTPTWSFCRSRRQLRSRAGPIGCQWDCWIGQRKHLDHSNEAPLIRPSLVTHKIRSSCNLLTLL